MRDLETADIARNKLMAEPDYVEGVLQRGAEKAREVSRPFMDEIRAAVGLRPLG